MGWYDGHMDGWGMGGWGVAGLVLTGLLVVALVVCVVLLLTRDRSVPRPPAGPPPEQLLAERYARGEIDDEEYQRRLAVLRDPAHSG